MVVATETVSGYAMRPNTELDRGRKDSRIVLPSGISASPKPRAHGDFPRSASYTYLGDAKTSPIGSPPSLATLKNALARHGLIAPSDSLVDISPPDSSGTTTPEEPLHIDSRAHARTAHDLVEQLQRSPKLAQHTLANAADDDNSSVRSYATATQSNTQPNTARPSVDSTRTVSTVASSAPVAIKTRQSLGRTFSKALHRRSWYGSSPSASSRSPSPVKTDSLDFQESGIHGPPAVAPVSTPSKRSMLRRKISSKSLKDKRTQEHLSDTDDQSGDASGLTRRSTFLKKKPKRLSGIFKGSAKDESTPSSPLSAVPPMPSIPKSFSTDKLPIFKSQAGLPDRAAPMPRLLSDDRVGPSSLLMPKKKDELWSVFRTLDGDYTKFASKSVALKANVVRSSLIPFLRTYASHPSNKTLRPEDLDRRAHILNKWWTGLIEMLHGRNNQSISGTDRPIILDGISGIMERSEWRLAPSQFCPLNERVKGTVSPINRSTISLSSNASEFLAESVHHNVRNIFVQNLSAQMAFVVDKMSLRNASASLVTFCGKACAFAFMFVPGMADVLIRLWDLQMDTIRRVLAENGIEKFDNLWDLGLDLTANFPPALQQLGFTSLMKYMRKLRTPPPLPLGTANVQWWGHWVERWSGRESDLFYAFVKHFHILATDFLPPGTSKQERLCTPGFLPVHAQILNNLEATIHRDVSKNQPGSNAPGSTPTFDDVLADPDAVATAMPLPPTNAVRIMAENRLIMLIRDFLSERTADHPIARQIFAESFNHLLQAAARGTSVFDHAGCYTLLDFLEEALLILVRYEHIKETEGNLINSEFWQLVCKKMIGSQNTMTEIRLYAFLYTVWNTVVCDLGRKTDLCLGLLLDPEIFNSRFNHWCPMVRAYFMRLLCWRVGRFDDEPSPGDDVILETMLVRLQSIWSQYLWLSGQMVKGRKAMIPTNPCHPAPGRRLLIVRTDPQISNGRSFLSFDGVKTQSALSAAQSALRRTSTLSILPEMNARPETSLSSSSTESVDSPEKGVGGFLRKMWGSKSSSKIHDPSSTSPPKPSERTAPTLSRVNTTTRRARSATESEIPRQRPTAKPAQPVPQPAVPHRSFSFRFSLEYHPNNRTLHGPIRLIPPRLPLPAQCRLLEAQCDVASPSHQVAAIEPKGEARAQARYCGRALAEWTVIVGECQSFFERRRNEGLPENRLVETPVLGVEVFKRPS